MSVLHHFTRHFPRFLTFAGLALLATAAQAGPSTQPAPVASAVTPATALDFKVTTIDGEPADLADYKGKVVLIVNVASQCGFTGQYAGLEELYEKYQPRGFVVLAFPANNFRKQEPGTNAQIKAFATSKFHVTFPLMAKISVLGDDKAELYRYLTDKQTAGDFAGEIEWNFTKVLVGRDAVVVARFPSKVTPKDPRLVAAIEAALDGRPPTAPPATQPAGGK